MKIILKIFCAPIILVLAITVGFCGFLLQLSATILGLISSILGLLGLLVLFTTNVTNGIIIVVLAFLISPLGIPMAAVWMLGQVQRLRYAIQDRVYG